MLGLRAIGPIFTFFRCYFDAEMLARLDSGTMTKNDSFDIFTWGGPLVSRQPRSRKGGWGLDYRHLSERKQLLQMLSAIAADLRELRQS